jgi:hypothetical protein
VSLYLQDAHDLRDGLIMFGMLKKRDLKRMAGENRLVETAR